MNRQGFVFALVCSAASLAIGNTESLDPAALSAGSFTTPEAGPNAFDLPVSMLDKEQMTAFAMGKEQFHEQWVVAPENGVWGLGPTFNEDRCSHCHENNGRAGATEHGKTAERGVLVRLSIPGADKNGGPLPHPVYGDQLQNRGVPGRVPEEGQAVITYDAKEVALPGGEKVTLRVPKVRFTQLQFGDLGKDTLYSVRTAQAMVGIGLLEAVPEKTILALAKTQEPHGMAGKPNYVWDVENELTVLGRFGWKANQPNIRQQTAAAFFGDVGATTYLFPEENCPPLQKACLELPSASKCGGQGGCTGNQFRPEVVPSRLSNITLYLQTLAVPARRNINDPAVKQGEALFAQAQCSVCHVSELKTDAKPAIRAAANQVIHPYTDLLLHDMGEELADGRPDFKASGREWRTAPLWGVGLLRTVNGHSDLLHDGRARNVTEAILWHGGQAEESRETFKRFSRAEREALVKFVESL
ncbi:MAG: thiol oxidoreductase [Betaproteobacteria bacterium]|nr:thiol oxidoreductase [Betaproteobacteria bacterium]